MMETNNSNTEMLQRMTRVETILENVNEKIDMAINAKDIAVEARSLAQNNTDRIKDLEDTQKWLARTIGATIIGIVITVIVAVIKMGVV